MPSLLEKKGIHRRTTGSNGLRSLIGMLSVLIGVAPVAARAAAGNGAVVSAVPLRHLATDEATEVAYLVRVGTADSLATASLLAHLVEPKRDSDKRPDSTALIQKAVALAPKRPELIWLLLRDCELGHCADERQIAARLRAIDPDNGAALLPELKAVQHGTAAEITQALVLIGDCKEFNIYWNKTLVMMFDAMTHGVAARPATALTQQADDRLSHAIGVLSAIDIPPFKPIIGACESNLAEPGRRAACEKLFARLDASDSIIGQSLSVSVQQKWWPTGSGQANGLMRRRLQQHYLVQASGREREGRVNQDAEMRVNAMRHLATEEEAAKAVLTAFQEPLNRPDDWHSPTGSE